MSALAAFQTRWSCLLATLFVAGVRCAHAQPIDFRAQIEPILSKNCYECHGPEKRRGGLRLDRKSAALKGGVTGALLSRGISDESLIVQRITGLGGEKRMPLERDPLPDAEIRLI